MLKPKRIIHSKNVTVVFWNDDTKTLVKCAKDETPDNYTAFCAAYCKKVFGNNSHLKRVIKDAENAKPEKVKKHKDYLDSLAIPLSIQEEFDRYMRRRFEDELCKPVKFLPVQSNSLWCTMPGCRNCKSVDTCSDCCSDNAVHCGAYHKFY